MFIPIEAIFLVVIAVLITILWTKKSNERLKKNILTRIKDMLGVSPERQSKVEYEKQIFSAENSTLYQIETALNRLEADVREKFLSQEQEGYYLEGLLMAIANPVVAISEQGKIEWCNAVFESQFVLGATLLDTFRDPEILSVFEDAIKNKKTTQSEMIYQDKVFSLTVSPASSGVVGVFHDISEIKKTEKIRIDFVANVSHELRTPLTAISGFSDLIQDQIQNHDFKNLSENMDILQKNIHRLKALVQDLLDLSAIESGVAFYLEEISLEELIERVVYDFKRPIALKIEQKNWVLDPRRMEQVIRNLIENAVKYVPEGRQIEVGTLKTSEGKLKFWVRDEGPGIAPQHLSRIFERFYRVEEDRARSDAGGTGLGLAIVKHIIQRHGGQVFSESKLGVGTTIGAIIPLRQASQK